MKRVVSVLFFIFFSLFHSGAFAQSSMVFFYCTGSAQELQSSVEVRLNGQKVASLLSGEVCKASLQTGKNTIECSRIGFGGKRNELYVDNEGAFFFHIQLKNARWEVMRKQSHEVPKKLVAYANQCMSKENLNTAQEKVESKLSKAIVSGEIPTDNSKVIVALQTPDSLEAEAKHLASIFENTYLKECTLIERNSLDLILEEQRLSLSAIFEEPSMQLGELISAEFICFIEIIPTSQKSEVLFSARIFNISTGEISYRYSLMGKTQVILRQMLIGD